MSNERYVARCVRSGGWWGVEISNAEGVHLKGGYTQAKRLDQVEPMVREVISLLLDVPEDSFDVQLEPELPEAIKKEVEEARALRQEAQTLRSQAEQAYQEAIGKAAEAARNLVDEERLTVRDVGQILGLSHQRVDQLLHKSPGPGASVASSWRPGRRRGPQVASSGGLPRVG
jgi:hypothetical protein